MSWTYRVVKVISPGLNEPDLYEVREVYSDPGKPNHSWSEKARSPSGEDLEDLKQDLKKFLKALDLPILVETTTNGKEMLVEEKN